MSDLTKVFEKLEAWRASPKIGQEGQVDEVHGWRNPVQLREDEVDAILSALKTVRGIEEITNTEGNSVTFVHKNADFNGLPNCCIVVTTDWSNTKTYRADTFAECVEAAGKKQ